MRFKSVIQSSLWAPFRAKTTPFQCRFVHDGPLKRERLALPTVAIIGRTNVGKSMLFNRLLGRKRAIVNPSAGTTRDRNEAIVKIGDLQFVAIDTPGFEGPEFRKRQNGSAEENLQPLMMAQTAKALDEATFGLFVVDAKEGVTQLDESIAKWLRKRGHFSGEETKEGFQDSGIMKNTPVYLVANKADNVFDVEDHLVVMKKLGFGEPVAVSALNGYGISSLMDIVIRHENDVKKDDIVHIQTQNSPPTPPNSTTTFVPGDAREEEEELGKLTQEEQEEIQYVRKEVLPPTSEMLRLSIIGRPNVGKSTLVNSILGEERVLVGPMPGVTRDSIDIISEYKGQKFVLVDTAGVRRKNSINDALEKDSVSSSLRAIHTSDAVVLMTDVMNDPLSKQDLRLANEAIDSGKILLVVVNKWDLMPPESAEAMEEWIEQRLQGSLPQIPNVPLLYLSALSGTNHELILEEVLSLYDRWSARVSTSKLNRWLRSATRVRSVPRNYGKLRYMTQITTQPPTFVIFQSGKNRPPESYMKYISNSMRENLDLQGVPIKVMVRHSTNPFSANH
eukprot:TRINITY_DN4821_c0_g1_i2.p1 TRINITY_DN4821_c0_g1~~TRINITY_DN4821_c0_g1_i2.p1  ORF type:complete len:562 (+),score=119.77 TRINITY_DN4821_c0_g1_i2:45-1730(+)